MSAFRRIGAALLILLGSAGLALSLAGIVGCWTLQASLGPRASRACEGIDSLVSMMNENIVPVRTALEKARTDLDSVREKKGQPLAPHSKEELLRQAMARKLSRELGPEFQDARRKLSSVAELGVVLNSLLEGVQELPLGRTSRLDFDRVEAVSERLIELIEAAQDLNNRVGKGSSDEIGETTSRMQERLAICLVKIDELTASFAEIEERAATLRTSLPRWLTAAAVLATVALLWIALGQISLAAHGVAIWRRVKVIPRDGQH